MFCNACLPVMDHQKKIFVIKWFSSQQFKINFSCMDKSSKQCLLFHTPYQIKYLCILAIHLVSCPFFFTFSEISRFYIFFVMYSTENKMKIVSFLLILQGRIRSPISQKMKFNIMAKKKVIQFIILLSFCRILQCSFNHIKQWLEMLL